MEFIMDGKIESITGIYTENTNVATPKYILKRKTHFTHKDIVKYADFELYCHMTPRELSGVMRGDMTIDLETIPLKDVPAGGVFISDAICTRRANGEEETIIALMVKETSCGETFCGDSVMEQYWVKIIKLFGTHADSIKILRFIFDERREVAYTGIILNDR